MTLRHIQGKFMTLRQVQGEFMTLRNPHAGHHARNEAALGVRRHQER